MRPLCKTKGCSYEAEIDGLCDGCDSIKRQVRKEQARDALCALVDSDYHVCSKCPAFRAALQELEEACVS